MFVHPPPSFVIDEVYGREYFEGASHGFGYVRYDEDKEPMIPTFRRYLDLIEGSLGAKGKLLDVGAATGFFVALARERGFDARGVELSEYAASLGRQKGLDIETGTLADSTGTYDAITMLDVIEHLPDPRADLKRAYALLRPGGVLVINTPDVGSLIARAFGLHWHLIVPPEHLYYFDRKNLCALLEETGFRVELCTTIGKSFTFAYILKTLYKWTRFSLFDRLASSFGHSFLGKLSIPVNVRDNMFILACKRVR